ncbi:Uncharacterised protein [Vibrio cholerae]|nr:Uncharacterised protein [Vibrio cholerae]
MQSSGYPSSFQSLFFVNLYVDYLVLLLEKLHHS